MSFKDRSTTIINLVLVAVTIKRALGLWRNKQTRNAILTDARQRPDI
jgi:hypothetical protein